MSLIEMYLQDVLLIILGVFFILNSKLFGSLIAQSQRSFNNVFNKNTNDSLEQDYGDRLIKIIGVAFIGVSLFNIYKKIS